MGYFALSVALFLICGVVLLPMLGILWLVYDMTLGKNRDRR